MTKAVVRTPKIGKALGTEGCLAYSMMMTVNLPVVLALISWTNLLLLLKYLLLVPPGSRDHHSPRPPIWI